MKRIFCNFFRRLLYMRLEEAGFVQRMIFHGGILRESHNCVKKPEKNCKRQVGEHEIFNIWRNYAAASGA